MKALPPGDCPSTYEYRYGIGGFFARTELQCSREAGHEGDHQFIRGSWVIVRWDNTPVSQKDQP